MNNHDRWTCCPFTEPTPVNNASHINIKNSCNFFLSYI